MKAITFLQPRTNTRVQLHKLVFLILSFALLSCSSDDSDDSENPENQVSAFRFEVSGDINKVIEGNLIVFNQTTTDGVTFEGEDTKLTTVLILAQPSSSSEEVAFAITAEGTDIGTGNFPIGFDLESFYNAFLNYSIEKGVAIDYQSSGGSISLSSKSSGFVSGSIDISCDSTAGGGSINISGTFTAPSAN